MLIIRIARLVLQKVTMAAPASSSTDNGQRMQLAKEDVTVDYQFIIIYTKCVHVILIIRATKSLQISHQGHCLILFVAFSFCNRQRKAEELLCELIPTKCPFLSVVHITLQCIECNKLHSHEDGN